MAKAISFLTITILLAFSALIFTAVSILTTQTSITNQGTIITVNVSCNTTSLDWGRVYLGMTPAKRTVQVTNTGNQAITLSLTHTAPTYLAISWDKEGVILQQGESIAANIFLLQQTQTTDFSFNFVFTITGTMNVPTSQN